MKVELRHWATCPCPFQKCTHQWKGVPNAGGHLDHMTSSLSSSGVQRTTLRINPGVGRHLRDCSAFVQVESDWDIKWRLGNLC